MAGPLSGQAIGPISEKIEQKFKSRLFLTKDSDCIEYHAGKSVGKYGAFYIGNGKNALPHRLAYELFVCPITPGQVINHICKNTRCCNPNHLEDVTQYENSEKGYSWTINGKCKRGLHDFTKENTLISGGKRSCRTCKNEQSQLRKSVLRGRPARTYRKGGK